MTNLTHEEYPWKITRFGEVMDYNLVSSFGETDKFEEIGLEEVEKNLATNRYSPGTLKHGLAQWFINSKKYEMEQKHIGKKLRLAIFSIWISGLALGVSVIALFR